MRKEVLISFSEKFSFDKKKQMNSNSQFFFIDVFNKTQVIQYDKKQSSKPCQQQST